MTDQEIVFGFAAMCAVLLFLPWVLMVLMKRFFHKNISYFRCFWIVLVASMILSGIDSYFINKS